MVDAQWICLTDAEMDERTPVVIQYGMITDVGVSPDDTGWTRIHTTGSEIDVTESIKNVFCAPVCHTPLLAIQKWEENA